ncbi:MAG: hypothetical protein LBC41_00210, partial [Clostridiales bacterium]|nr:hypothetical protein [Clostridiales bacterium]
VLGSNTPSRDALRSAECAQATFLGFLDVILRRASTLYATLFGKSNNPVQPEEFWANALKAQQSAAML